MTYAPEITLPKILSEHRERRFVFLEPGGNWGDRLIYWGAEFLADSIGLDWSRLTLDEFDPTELTPGDAVYVHGGGGYNGWCSGRAAAALRLALSSYAGLVVQGPQSYDDKAHYTTQLFATMFDSYGEKAVHVFARERTSIELLRATLPDHVGFSLDVDTALHLTRDEFLSLAGDVSPKFHLLGIRRDAESPADAGISAHGVRVDPAKYARSFDHWVRIHAAAKTIRTNRTHSAVAGAILGIPTTMYAGSYHKNRSVWEYALEPRGVQWGEYSSVGTKPRIKPEAEKGLWSRIRTRVRTSNKLRRTLRDTRLDRLPRLLKRLRGVPLS
jgi:exopolysaccharide biosynthesis predicted pyruvyltransferase EpsI